MPLAVHRACLACGVGGGRARSLRGGVGVGETEMSKPRLTDCSLLTIQIVGTLPPITREGEADWQREMGAFLDDVGKALQAHFPAFIPARPPVTIHIADLAEPGE